MQLVDECLASGQIQTWIHNSWINGLLIKHDLAQLKKKNVNRNNMGLKHIKTQSGTRMY